MDVIDLTLRLALTYVYLLRSSNHCVAAHLVAAEFITVLDVPCLCSADLGVVGVFQGGNNVLASAIFDAPRFTFVE
jgi:hypothetical protein